MEMNQKQQAALDAIYNFILYHTSNEEERDRLFENAFDYVFEDHYLSMEENQK